MIDFQLLTGSDTGQLAFDTYDMSLASSLASIVQGALGRSRPRGEGTTNS